MEKSSFQKFAIKSVKNNNFKLFQFEIILLKIEKKTEFSNSYSKNSFWNILKNSIKLIWLRGLKINKY